MKLIINTVFLYQYRRQINLCLKNIIYDKNKIYLITISIRSDLEIAQKSNKLHDIF